MSFVECKQFMEDMMPLVQQHSSSRRSKRKPCKHFQKLLLGILYWQDHSVKVDKDPDLLVRLHQRLHQKRVEAAAKKREALENMMETLPNIGKNGGIVPQINENECTVNDIMYATQLAEDAAEIANSQIPPSKLACVSRRVRWNVQKLGVKLLNAGEIMEFFNRNGV